MNEPKWDKSSYSSNGGNCVEVARNMAAAEGIIPVRDSKDPNGPVLTFSPSAWSAFVAATVDGKFGNV
ncbi:DUF397 domain-containing protein [Kitasatospora sp. NPDC048407]|uniref:DUF397 domain-containing protein n=1 Tax=Kitasatospora sp. NPDC048407 TaxID=3364051 RepID=UPI003713EDBD